MCTDHRQSDGRNYIRKIAHKHSSEKDAQWKYKQTDTATAIDVATSSIVREQYTANRIKD